MKFEYRPKGVCAQRMLFDVEGGIVTHVQIIGGCSGNSQGVAALVEGQEIDDVIRRIGGIRCGLKQTSCPDQLACALQEAKTKIG